MVAKHERLDLLGKDNSERVDLEKAEFDENMDYYMP